MFLNLRRYYGKRFSRFVLWRGFAVYDELRGGGDGSNASSQPTVKSKADKPAGKDLGEKPQSNNNKNAGGVSSGLEESDDGFSNSGAGGSSSGNQNDNGSNSSGSTGNTGSGNSGSNGGSQGGSTGGSTNPSTKPQNNSFKITFDVAQGASVATNKSFVITVNQDIQNENLDKAIELYRKDPNNKHTVLETEISYSNRRITVKPKQNLGVDSNFALKVKAFSLVAVTGGKNQFEHIVGFNTKTAVESCSNGFALQDKDGNKCYKFFNDNEKQTYDNAKKECEKLNATLAQTEIIVTWLKQDKMVDDGVDWATGSKSIGWFEKLGGKYGTEYWIDDSQTLTKSSYFKDPDVKKETSTNAEKAFICYKDKIVPEVVGSGKFDGEKTVTFKFNKDLKGFAANSSVVLKNGQGSSNVNKVEFKKETKTLTVELANVESGKQYTLTLNPSSAGDKISDYYGNTLAMTTFGFSKAGNDNCKESEGRHKVGNGCYFKGEGYKGWSEAKAYCESMGASLVSMADSNDFNSIADKLKLIKYKPGYGESDFDAQPYWLKDEYKDPWGGSPQYRFFWYQKRGGWQATERFGKPHTLSDIEKNRSPFICKLN
ncbi:MAG: C-type lectin domain-containing protein [Helicobacteraceae bacterium]